MSGKKPTDAELLEQANMLLRKTCWHLKLILRKRKELNQHRMHEYQALELDFLDDCIKIHLKGVDFTTGAPY